MFTIKHIASNGTEFAIEAKSYRVDLIFSEGGTSECAMFACYDNKHGFGDCIAQWSGERRHADAAGVGKIYVMNSAGATVAAHYFADNFNQAG